MTKSNLIVRMLLRFPELKKEEARLIIDYFFDTIYDNLVKGNNITLRGFGSFYIKKRKAGAARNPRTGARFAIDPKSLPAFKVGKKFINRLN